MADDAAGSPCDDFTPHAFKKDLCANCKRTQSVHDSDLPVRTSQLSSLSVDDERRNKRQVFQRAATVDHAATSSFRPTLRSSASIEGKHVGFADDAVVISTDGGIGSTENIGIEGIPEDEDTSDDLRAAISLDDQLAIETVKNTRRNSTTLPQGSVPAEDEVEEMYKPSRFRKVSSGRKSPPPRLLAEDVPRDSVGAPSPHYYHKYDFDRRGLSGCPIPIQDVETKEEDSSSDNYHLYEDVDTSESSLETNKKAHFEAKKKAIAEEVRVWKTFDERFSDRSSSPDSRQKKQTGGNSFFKRLFRRGSDKGEEIEKKVVEKSDVIMTKPSSPLLRKAQFTLKQDDFLPSKSANSSPIILAKKPSETDSGRSSTVNSTSSSSDIPTLDDSYKEEELSLMDQILEEVPLASDSLMKSPKTKKKSISIVSETSNTPLTVDITPQPSPRPSISPITPDDAPTMQAPRKPRPRSEVSVGRGTKPRVRMNEAPPPPPPGTRRSSSDLKRPSSPPPLPPNSGLLSSSIHATLPRSSAARIARQRERNRGPSLKITDWKEAESVVRNTRSRTEPRNSRRTVTEGVKLDLDLAGSEMRSHRVTELLDTFPKPRKFADRALPSPPVQEAPPLIVPSEDVYETVGEELNLSQLPYEDIDQSNCYMRPSSTYLEPSSCLDMKPDCPPPKTGISSYLSMPFSVRDSVPEVNVATTNFSMDVIEIQSKAIRSLCKIEFVRKLKSHLPESYTDYFVEDNAILTMDEIVFMKAKPLLGNDSIILMVSKSQLTSCHNKHPHVLNPEISFKSNLPKDQLPLEFLDNPLEKDISTYISVLNCENVQTIRDVVYALYIDVDPSQYGRECAKLMEQVLSAAISLKIFGLEPRLDYANILVAAISGQKYAIVIPSDNPRDSAGIIDLFERLIPSSARPKALRDALKEKDYRTAHILLCVMLWGPTDQFAVQTDEYAEKWIVLQKTHLLSLTATGEISKLEANRRANFLNNLTVNLLQQCLRRLSQG